MGDDAWTTGTTLAIAAALATIALVPALAGNAGAVHFFRGGQDLGCEPASGAISDDGSSAEDTDVTVNVLHNTYHDGEKLGPVTVIEPGDTVTWVWNSEHCHSVTGADEAFDSGFVYPEEPPDTPQAVPGFFDHPVPTLDEPSLTYSHTFEEPGVYPYACVHHSTIGMQGVVIVQG